MGIDLYVRKRLLNVGHILLKGVSMQRSFEEKNKEDLNWSRLEIL